MEAKVTGIFPNRQAAQLAVRILIDAGFESEDISIAARQYGEAMDVGIEGLLVGLGGVAAPGTRALIAAGPLAKAQGGSAVGAVGGGLKGPIRDLGLMDDQVDKYMKQIDSGAVLVAVQTSIDRAKESAHIFESLGATNVHRIGRRDRAMPLGRGD